MKMRICVLGSLVGLLLLASQNRPAIGRPANVKVFAKTYEQEYSKITVEGKFSCTMCHEEGEKKSVQNNYGDALNKVMAEKNLDRKNPEMVEKGLREVEPLPSAIPGWTFGDLIKAGKHPASKKLVSPTSPEFHR